MQKCRNADMQTCRSCWTIDGRRGGSKAGKLRMPTHRLARQVWAQTRLMQVSRWSRPWVGGSPRGQVRGPAGLGRGRWSPTRAGCLSSGSGLPVLVKQALQSSLCLSLATVSPCVRNRMPLVLESFLLL
jgi:hypothetical protein